MYTANSSILYSKEKTLRILGNLTSILSECFWAPLFQTNRISRRINKLSENLTSLIIFTLNIKPFLRKYHILPTLFWAALILLRSKERKYYPWSVYSREQNGVFCDCFASFQLAKNFILKLKCSAFIRNTSFTDNWKGRLKNWVFVVSVRILVPLGYWATYCILEALKSVERPCREGHAGEWMLMFP